jgi:putative molybdopterin biosynthesis protein
MQKNYLTNTPIDQALVSYEQALRSAGCCLMSEQQVPVKDALGLTVSRPVYAARNVPHFLASAMDGIAVRACATFGATETTPVILTEGQFTVVDTGDPISADYDAVVMSEDIVWHANHIEARLYQAAVPWQHIRQIGEDFCGGDMILTGGTTITPAAIGLLLAGGVQKISVYRRLIAAIIPTGDEIVPAETELRPGDIPESNSYMVAAALKNTGIDAASLPIVPDDPDIIRQVLADAIDKYDLVFLLAGSSAGRDDHSSDVISSLGSVIVHGLAIKPGKPAILAECKGKPVIGMPGYPVSALIVLDYVVFPVLGRLTALKLPYREKQKVRLSRRLVSSLKYQEYVRVRLSLNDGRWHAVPLERGAGMLSSIFRADAILTVSQNCDGFDAGSEVEVELLRDRNILQNTLSLVGSHDPLLDELSDIYQRLTGSRLTSTHVGSLGGLMALKRNETVMTAAHLLDPESGIYNQCELTRIFPDNSVVLIEGYRRVQGLMVQKGNPHKIKSINDLTGVKKGFQSADKIRYVNRQSGSGTRVLLDYLLKANNICVHDVSGYEREETTHSAVAAQISEGSADVGLGILSAARIFGLDFIPLAEECYDFAVRSENLKDKSVQYLIALLKSEELLSRLEGMGGYRWIDPGRQISDFSDHKASIICSETEHHEG